MSEDASQTPREPLDVHVVIMTMLDQMVTISWQKLGLQPDIMTGKIERDLVQAKVAIDLTAHLASVLESQLDEDDRRRIQGLVRDLRINWVEKNTEVNG